MGWNQGMGPTGKYGGIDISNHQPPRYIDMPTVAQNVDFFWHKATEGTGFVDKYWAGRSGWCRDNNLPYGAYHFSRPDQNGWKAEADHFLRHIDGKETIAPCLDWEHKSGIQRLGKAGATDWCLNFMARIEENTGQTPWFYTSYYIARDMMSHDPALGRYPLWEAWYATADNHQANQARVDSGWIPPTPPQWSGVSMWQYSSAARNIPGCGGVRIDCNVSYVAPWNADVTPPPPKPAPPPVVQPPADDGTLRPGSRGDKVKSVQTILNALGHLPGDKNAVVDGVYGPATTEAVKKYQAANGLTVDGIVGPNTLKKMFAFLGAPEGPTRGEDWEGLLERIEVAPGKIRIIGWGVDPKNGKETPEFRLLVDGKPTKFFKANRNRKDVVEFNSNYALKSGFNYVYDVAPGKHQIAVHVKMADGVYFNLWQSPQEDIEVPKPAPTPDPKPVPDADAIKALKAKFTQLKKSVDEALAELDKLA